jgi:hypothetical protein
MIQKIFSSNLLKNISTRVVLPIFIFSFSLSAFVAFEPLMPGTNLDDAWKYGINYAVDKGFVFGKDLVFTFGPYAGIITKS